jgi:peroxiredoxin
VIGVGERVPDAQVWRSTRERVSLRELASGGPFVLFFYLFDWSST